MSRPAETDMLKAHIFNFELYDNSENPLTGKGLYLKYLDSKNVTPEKTPEEFNPVLVSSCSSIYFTQGQRPSITLTKGLSSEYCLGSVFKSRMRALIKINIFTNVNQLLRHEQKASEQFNGKSFFFMYNCAEWSPFISLDGKSNSIAEEKIVLNDCEFLGVRNF